MARRVFAFQSAATVLARIPLQPADAAKDRSLEPDPLLAEAIFVASRHVDPVPGAGGLSRLAVTNRGYEIRARWRPTPHGSFAGVAPAQFAKCGEAAALQMSERHRARTNPSARWLATICDRLVADPAILRRLTLTTSNLVARRGSRLEHEWRDPGSGRATQRITIRATDATLRIMRMCRNGVPAKEVISDVTERWAVTEALVTATLTKLARGGFVRTDLLPDDINNDPLGHLVRKLPHDHSLRAAVTRLRQLLADADGHPPGEHGRLEALHAARNLADQMFLCERPLSVDVAADAHITLPPTLADDAAEAAGVLWRISPGRAPLSVYHDRFLDRYGSHRFVPLLDATDAAAGLSLDIDADDSGDSDPSSRRIAFLASLISSAVACRKTEVILDTAAIGELVEDVAGLPPPRTAEIHLRVIAATPQDLAAGRLRLAVCPGSGQNAGSTLGRFADLIPGASAGDGRPSSAVLVAEIAVCPRIPEGAAIAPPTGFAPWRIPVGVPAREGDLELDDLLLVSNGAQLLVWSARHGRQVIPVLYSRLAPGLLPPVGRFLQLLGQAGCPGWHGWSWGPLRHGPFQPQVRFGRTVLAPARWVLPPSVTRAVHDRTSWNHALNTWRAAAVPSPPDVVVTDDDDRRLPLDLRRADDRELLRRYVRRGLTAVCEQPGGPDAVHAVVAGPTGQHVLELVVPLARCGAMAHTARPATIVRGTARTGLFLPGGPWLSLAVRAPVTCHDEILLRLTAITTQLAGQFDRWFWLRYADAAHGPHLRVRFHGQPSTLGSSVLPAISAWCADLIKLRLSAGFTVQPYDQEIERYGGPDAICPAELVFAADSQLVLGIVAATADPDQRLLAAAVSAAAIARTVADGDLAAVNGHRLDRAARHRVVALRPQARAVRSWDTARSPLWCAADPAWSTRHETLAAYRVTLKPAQRSSCASALIHMHANRLLGVTGDERIARALASDILALSLSAR